MWVKVRARARGTGRDASPEPRQGRLTGPSLFQAGHSIAPDGAPRKPIRLVPRARARGYRSNALRANGLENRRHDELTVSFLE